MERRAVLTREDESVVLPCRSCCEVFLALTFSIVGQRSDRCRIKCERASALRGLGFGELHPAVVDDRQAPDDGESSAPQIDMVPRQSEKFPVSHPGCGDEQPGGEEAMFPRLVDKRAHLLRCPDLHLRRARAWRVRGEQNSATSDPTARRRAVPCAASCACAEPSSARVRHSSRWSYSAHVRACRCRSCSASQA